jgi:hypothetical protein
LAVRVGVREREVGGGRERQSSVDKGARPSGRVCRSAGGLGGGRERQSSVDKGARPSGRVCRSAGGLGHAQGRRRTRVGEGRETQLSSATQRCTPLGMPLRGKSH